MVKVGKWIAKHKVLVLLIGLLLVIPSVIGIAETRVNYDLLSYLPEHLETVKGQDILETIISLGGKLGMEVITEGVETDKQLIMLTEMGCHIFQGYYFSKPIPVEEFEQKYMNE